MKRKHSLNAVQLSAATLAADEHDYNDYDLLRDLLWILSFLSEDRVEPKDKAL